MGRLIISEEERKSILQQHSKHKNVVKEQKIMAYKEEPKDGQYCYDRGQGSKNMYDYFYKIKSGDSYYSLKQAFGDFESLNTKCDLKNPKIDQVIKVNSVESPLD